MQDVYLSVDYYFFYIPDCAEIETLSLHPAKRNHLETQVFYPLAYYAFVGDAAGNGVEPRPVHFLKDVQPEDFRAAHRHGYKHA